MAIQFRNYTKESGFTDDFHAVRKFLLRINEEEPFQYDFLWGRWEWAFSLQYLDTANISKIGVWESDGEIVALAAYESAPGTIYFGIDKEYSFLKKDILLYTRDNLRNPENKLKVLIKNSDREFQIIASALGFTPSQETEPHSVIDIDLDRLHYTLPPGYSILSLADDFDLIKFHRVLWNGFNHEGEAPTTEVELAHRKYSISGPDLNLDQCILVAAPDGNYASFCGMWHEPGTDYTYVEPVATDPKYRKLGLGKAAVLEGVRRCGLAGAKKAFVGSSQQFYYRIGFHPIPAGTFWEIS
jgi:GNAT superfamily N-acetyltransferase